MRQMGDDYADPKEFARKSRAALRKIQALYPALKLGPLRGGIRIEPDSLPAITPRPTVTVEHTAPERPAEKSEPPLAIVPKDVTLDIDRLLELYRQHLTAAAEAGTSEVSHPALHGGGDTVDELRRLLEEAQTPR
jgi:hypothetical protein